MRRAAALFAALMAGPAPAAGPEQTWADACATCHGADLRGGGPMAAILTVPVPDLTRIAWRDGGRFDRARVIGQVDGTIGLGAHGGPMPMYGGHLTGATVAVPDGAGGTVETTQTILALVDWIATQQRQEE